jgi:hypothetical protein
LAADGIGKCGVGVTECVDSYAREKIEVLAAVGVPHEAAFAAN